MMGGTKVYPPQWPQTAWKGALLKRFRQIFSLACLPILLLALVGCTAEQSSERVAKQQQEQLRSDLDSTIRDLDRRLAAVPDPTPTPTSNGHRDGNGRANGDALDSAIEFDRERLLQIRSALLYRKDQIDRISEQQWPEFRADAERLMLETRTLIDRK